MPCAYFVCCFASDGRSSKYWLFRSILHPGKSMEGKGNEEHTQRFYRHGSGTFFDLTEQRFPGAWGVSHGSISVSAFRRACRADMSSPEAGHPGPGCDGRSRLV